VPLGVQRCDVVIRDGFATSTTFRGKQGQVIRPAVWLPILLMETLLSKLLTAVGTEKVLMVPIGVQCRYTFLKGKYKTMSTIPLSLEGVVFSSFTSKMGPLQ
jgi:hypothetical protein